MLLKCCTQYVSTFGKLSRGHRTGKCQFSLQSQGRAMPNKQTKKSSNCQIIALIFHANKVMFKIVQARVQQYVNRELPDVQAGFRRDRRIRIKWPTSVGHRKSKGIPEKHLLLFLYYTILLNYTKAFDCVHHNQLWKTLQETGIPDHLTCLLRNLYADQGERVRTRHGTINCFKIVKVQGCILSLCLFNYYAEYIM